MEGLHQLNENRSVCPKRPFHAAGSLGATPERLVDDRRHPNIPSNDEKSPASLASSFKFPFSHLAVSDLLAKVWAWIHQT